jgi:hypothetical protein
VGSNQLQVNDGSVERIARKSIDHDKPLDVPFVISWQLQTRGQPGVNEEQHRQSALVVVAWGMAALVGVPLAALTLIILSVAD